MQPFKDIKVIELSSVLAGPSVGMFFAELGAQVLKIENPQTGGDVTRKWKLPQEDANKPVSAYFAAVNYGKTFLKLNLKNKEERECFIDLIKDADILITNFINNKQEKLQISYPALKKQNPSLIQINITGYGDDSSKPAFDLVLQAETGYMSMNGEADGLPLKMPVALIDVLCAHQAKEAALIALYERSKNNCGQYYEVNLYQSAVSALVNQASNYLNVNYVPKRIGSLHPNIAPYGETFPLKDDRYLVLAVGSNEHFFRLCKVLNLSSLTQNSKYITNQQRVKNRKELYEILYEKIKIYSSTDITPLLEKENIPHAIVKQLDEVFNNKLANSMMLNYKVDGCLLKCVSSIAFRQKTY